jgi:hypothetical protein
MLLDAHTPDLTLARTCRQWCLDERGTPSFASVFQLDAFTQNPIN